jgi:hypothetical protein
MISQILVPMDDSEMAQRALEYVLENHPGAEVTECKEKASRFSAGMNPTTGNQTTHVATAGYSTNSTHPQLYVSKNAMLTYVESGGHSDTQSESL